jgi:RNA polymerase sigma factor (sigma-70 family)
MTEEDYNYCVENHADNVYRFILKNLRSEADARDVVQAAFEKLWIHKASVEPTKSKAYLFTVAYNQMIDHLRKLKKVQLKDNFSETMAIIHQQPNNLKKILEQALYTLSETQRTLVLLKDYEGYSYEEIGSITNLNPSQVKVYLHRARAQLKNYLVSPANIV